MTLPMDARAANRIGRFITDTLGAVNELHKRGYVTQGLVLLYSAMDTLAWACVPSGEVTSAAFMAWANKYFLPGSELPCTAEDLYAARCGLLHSHAAVSKRSAEGKARQIWYYGKPASEALAHAQIGDRADVVAVRYIGLVIAFSEAATRLMSEMEADPVREAQILARMAHWLAWVDTDTRRLVEPG